MPYITAKTLLELLHDLFSKFIKDQTREYLVIESDQKLYEVLQSLKFEYGRELDWVISIPGDWHMLMNFQSALMKPYFDAGLKDLAKAAGYPVATIQTWAIQENPPFPARSMGSFVMISTFF